MITPTRLGPYEIGKPIGKGGMGSVYEATDVETGQRVAIKALNPHLALAEGFRERFEAEIESLKTLRHDGIVRLYGYGEQDGILFYSMELVNGVSLEDELKAGRRFQWREVANIAVQVCHALKHAHDHGIIHRDIKPANILQADDEHVKLADFGIARLFGGSQLTMAGGVLGTADYMSPEQTDGRPITARCDQYSLGGVMYALLAGRPPFRAKHLPEMLQLQRFANPEPVRRFAPDTPEQLEKVILQLLSKEPADRFPNTLVLARHLQAMMMAFSQPLVADSATTGGSPQVRDADVEISIALAATQAEAPPGQPASSGTTGGTRDRAVSSDAATLAPEQLAGRPQREIDLSVRPSLVTPRSTQPEGGIASGDHFTSVEEEQARLRKLQQRSWVSSVPQLAGLATALAVLAAIAFYLSRPLTADGLYTTIVSRATSDKPETLRDVEHEIREFLQRFPSDPRAAQLQHYRRQLELDRLARNLEFRARRNGTFDSALLPVESLYLQASNTAETSPDEAVTMLQSLVDLYGSNVPVNNGGDGAERDEEANRQAACVQLARNELARLREELAKQTAQQLKSLRERLAAAERIAAERPDEAATMYRAIIELYQDDAWAEEEVAAARSRLEEREIERQEDKETRKAGDGETRRVGNDESP